MLSLYSDSKTLIQLHLNNNISLAAFTILFAINNFNKDTVVQDTWILKARTGVISLRNPGGLTSQVPLTQRNGLHTIETH